MVPSGLGARLQGACEPAPGGVPEGRGIAGDLKDVLRIQAVFRRARIERIFRRSSWLISSSPAKVKWWAKRTRSLLALALSSTRLVPPRRVYAFMIALDSSTQGHPSPRRFLPPPAPNWPRRLAPRTRAPSVGPVLHWAKGNRFHQAPQTLDDWAPPCSDSNLRAAAPGRHRHHALPSAGAFDGPRRVACASYKRSVFHPSH